MEDHAITVIRLLEERSNLRWEATLRLLRVQFGRHIG